MKSLHSAMLAGLFVLLAGPAAAQSEDMKTIENSSYVRQ